MNQQLLAVKMNQACSGYLQGTLQAYLPLLGPETAESSKVQHMLEKWRELYAVLQPVAPPPAEEGAELEAKRGGGELVVTTESTKELLRILLDDLAEHHVLRIPWPVCRHILSVALILRLSERFMDHLAGHYTTPEAWIVTDQALSAYELFRKVELPPENLKPGLEPRAVYENDINYFHRYREQLVRSLRQLPSPPFTLVRICELLLPDDTSWRSNFWKWCLAVQKNIIDPYSSYPQSSPPAEEMDPDLLEQIMCNYKLDTPSVLEDYHPL